MGEKFPEVTTPLISPDIPIVLVLAIFLDLIVNFFKILWFPSCICAFSLSEPKKSCSFVIVQDKEASTGVISSVNSKPYNGSDASSLSVSLEPSPHGFMPFCIRKFTSESASELLEIISIPY